MRLKMENQQSVQYERAGALKNFKVMNKLGTLFFAMFLIGAMLPLVDLGGWSNETLSLYYFEEPTFLMILAVAGLAAFVSGISRTAARVIALLFVGIILIECISQILDLYDIARSWEQLFESLPIRGKDLISAASVMLSISFIGIFGCVFAPRYKENKQLKAAITGQAIIGTEGSDTANGSKNAVGDSVPMLEKIKNFIAIAAKKILDAIKYIYQIIQPPVNAMLDKVADIVCEKQPQLKREQVKLALLIVLVVLIYLIVF
jgi:hypothetical protein